MTIFGEYNTLWHMTKQSDWLITVTEQSQVSMRVIDLRWQLTVFLIIQDDTLKYTGKYEKIDLGFWNVFLESLNEIHWTCTTPALYCQYTCSAFWRYVHRYIRQDTYDLPAIWRVFSYIGTHLLNMFGQYLPLSVTCFKTLVKCSMLRKIT